eukprot:TRINITY_DN12442_c0_g1_i1.p1 TRINITY_DN12442_c0_g1~~TRINITY_DN12442_c0_g1_i1.p1  ORF type:complete len:128 (+),score=63.29 TRINITY_DN12442_c0_g1_i1:9-392(+)
MIRRPPRSTQSRSSAASDVYKRQNTLPANSFIMLRFDTTPPPFEQEINSTCKITTANNQESLCSVIIPAALTGTEQGSVKIVVEEQLEKPESDLSHLLEIVMYGFKVKDSAISNVCLLYTSPSPRDS